MTVEEQRPNEGKNDGNQETEQKAPKFQEPEKSQEPDGSQQAASGGTVGPQSGITRWLCQLFK
ncbi:MAG: hypothetical protein WCC18_15675 [Candidatus Acidiferrales bacterium]